MPERTELTPEAAAGVIEFARACKAAARAVSLYPGGHPAINTSLARLAQVSARLTAQGPFQVQSVGDTLLVEGAKLPRSDAGVTELAELLHRHAIGQLTVNAGANAESWRTLLLLMARAPADVRADGGIRHLWATAGGPSIEIDEIDYAEVLRQKQGVAAAVEQIVAAAIAGRRLDLDDSAMRLLLDIVQDRVKLDTMMSELEAAATTHGASVQAAAFLSLLKRLTEWLSAREPQHLDSMFRQMGRAAGKLSAEAMLTLLEQRHKPDARVGSINVAGVVIERMNDESIAGFVAGSVLKERGATERLAHAFQALVPDVDRQRQVLALAQEQVAGAEPATDHFAELWSRVESMLTSYTDERFVSEEYARELSGARTRPLDVERVSDDPPERISAWLSTVSDAALRRLDHRLLTDLLKIERDPLRWRDIADTAASHAEDLVRVGYFDLAWELSSTVAAEAEADPARRPHASAALARFGRGSMMKHVAVYLRSADDTAYERFKGLCHAIGPGVVPGLAEALSSEQDARSRRRLRDILLGFGAKGSEAVRQLMHAPNWEVRRTAAYLLREFGGTAGLKELVPLLTDDEPLVQREAVQGLVSHGSEEAARILLEAISTGSGRTRERLMHELASIRDERAAPLFNYLVRHVDRRKEHQLYRAAIEALGSLGGEGAVDGLRHALYAGDWRAPLQTRRLRSAAAHALRLNGTPAAMRALHEAAERGPRGVRAVARAQLADTL